MDRITKYFPNLSPGQLNQFEALLPLYQDWNEKINVISRKDLDNFYEHHVLHSLAIAAVFNFPGQFNILDLGTGGGFPGIPLAIFFPDVQFHLVDSINKKLKVIEVVASQIGLTNVTIQHSRAEDIPDRKFDVVLSRAVAPLKQLLVWSNPLLKKQPAQSKNQGGLICLKGGDLSVEIAESRSLPAIWDIKDIFHEPFFDTKFILHVSL